MKAFCIFRVKCAKCHLLTLKSEKHSCGKFSIPTNQGVLVKRIWKLLNEYTRATASSLAYVIFGRLRNKEFARVIRIILNRNRNLFSYYYPRGTNYYCTIQTYISLRSK